MDAEEGEDAQQQGGQEQALAGEEGLNALLQAMNEEDEDEEEEDEEDEMEHGEADAESGPEEPEETASDPILDKGVKQYGCEHYRRRAMIVAPCCDKPFWCRHCHNMQVWRCGTLGGVAREGEAPAHAAGCAGLAGPRLAQAP